MILSLVLALVLTPLEEYIQNNYDKEGVPGVAVSVVDKEGVLLSKGYGMADSAEPMNEHTIFQLASISKSFTAMALATLVKDWDTPVIQQMPHFLLFDRYATRFSTPRDLLSHRTGLPAFGGDLLGKLGYSDEEILRRVQFIEPAVSFRERPLYLNVGYFLAGELIRALSGESWDKVVQEKILTPLGMKRSGFAENLQSSNVAAGFMRGKGGIRAIPHDTTGGFPAAGGVTSTAADMAKWMTKLLEGPSELFAPAAVAEIAFSEAPPISKSTGFFYTLGWDTYFYRGHQIVEKAGGLDGVRTITTLIPDLGLGITVLANLNLTLFPEKVRAKFLQIALGGDLGNFSENEAIMASLLTPPEREKDPLPPSRPLQAFTGKYESKLYGIFSVEEEGNRLVVHAGPAKFKGTLEHVGNNTFSPGRW